MQNLQKKLDTFNYVYDAMNSDYQKMKTAKISNTERLKLYRRMKELFDNDLDDTFHKYKFYLNMIHPKTKDILIEKYEDKHFRATVNHYCL